MATQWEVWREMRGHLGTGHTAYLMGQIRDTGWRIYYPLAFALKTPPLTLMLLAIGLVAAVAAGPRRWLTMLPLWIYVGGYTLAALLSTVSTGYWFLLPVLHFGFILAAGLFRDGSPVFRLRVFRWVSWLVLVLVGTVVAARLYPDYTSISPRRSMAFATNPSLPHLTLPILPSRFNPAPGIYVIGATTLQGVIVVDPDTYDWFRHREPIGRGHSQLRTTQTRDVTSFPQVNCTGCTFLEKARYDKTP